MTSAGTINNESETMRTEIINVTPELAAEWLQANTGNRNAKKFTIDQYARDMAAGRWAMTGEAIKFAVGGRLLDGQNRCHAIIKAGVTVPMLVVFDLPDEAQVVMDCGIPRTAGDALTISGAKNAHLLGAVAKLAVHWQRGDITRANCSLPPLSPAEINAAVIADETLVAAAAAGNRFFYKKREQRGIHAVPSAIGFAWWLIAGAADSEVAESFMGDLEQMRTNGSGDPRFAALQRLNNAHSNGEKLRNITQTFVLISAWNAFREGRRVSRIQLSNNQGEFQAFPEVSS